MFVLKTDKTYKWPVTIETPNESGGTSKHKITCVFKTIPQSRFDEIAQDAANGDVSIVDALKELLVGWEGITDQDGNTFSYSEENKAKLLDVMPVPTCIWQDWAASANPKAAGNAKRKN